MSDIVTKCCAECNQEKPETEFSRTRGAKRQPFCKACLRQRQKAGYAAIHPPATPDGYKQCSHCQRVFASTTEFFYSNKSRSDGLNPLCKTCHQEYEHTRIQQKPKETPPETLICVKCNEEKPATREHFFASEASPYGLQSTCKICRNAEQRTRYHMMDSRRRERVLCWQKEYQRTHREERRNYWRAWYRATREHRRTYRKMYRKLEHSIAYRRIEVRNRRARKLQAPGYHTRQDIQRQYKRQKGRCYWCNNKLSKGKRQVHVDHIVPLSRGGSNWPDNLVIACHTCNERRNNRLPHEWPEGGRLL